MLLGMEPTEMVAARVRELRQKRDWTAQQLAEEMTNAGMPWNRGVVTKLENGRRDSVSIEELLTLAWVFDVPPLVLLLPDDPGSPVEITPTVSARAERAYRWLMGVTPVPIDVAPETHPGVWGERIARYATDRPSYMTNSPEADPALLDRLERHDRQLAELQAQLQKLSQKNERSEHGDETD